MESSEAQEQRMTPVFHDYKVSSIMLISIKAATLLKGNYERIILCIFWMKNVVCIINIEKEAFLNAI